MSKKIWKYTLECDCMLTMPFGSKVLSVEVQHGKICLWALVNPTEIETEDRTFIVYGTGHEVTETNLEFIGTTLMDNGALVWHVFEVLNV